MEQKPPSATIHGSNCFDVIRHAAAFLVMISHHFALNGLPEPKIFGSTKLGTVAVIIFFSISGYLITSSFINSQSSISYMKKRVLRIFPGLIACSFIMTFLIFPFFGENHQPTEWIASINSIKSFIFFSLFGSPGSGELVNGFTNYYIFPDSANGSLWSLKFEFFDYIAILMIFSVV
ncbi:TPA: acyltransferase, partial [Raoultella ornithinolytica]|nr:acyltransferase [Raoultella ornithinolytica]